MSGMASDDLGRRIKRARERKHWSQQQLADAIEAGVRSVGRWERGEAIPKNRIGALEAVLGINLDEPGNGQVMPQNDDEQQIWEMHWLSEDERRELIVEYRQRRTRRRRASEAAS